MSIYNSTPPATCPFCKINSNFDVRYAGSNQENYFEEVLCCSECGKIVCVSNRRVNALLDEIARKLEIVIE